MRVRERPRRTSGINHETVLVVFVMAVLASVSAQDFRHFFAGFGPYSIRDPITRDPRSNRGPVLFPPGPPPNNADTSGVVVGASGYGFVPPSAGNSFGF
ncbi:PREDICTED: uncharacterized protein LOC108771712 isoform X1 [Cyphomyrmex costatus]|uniref:uncharacterized protein LOC108771712 isoform X1 n=1 Tax=Cyphomyrmex costatus TaxID=456900 RepID=UPI0008523A0C|nr:PREDICTED: uncharacterized protein LOC108771712 isoform X1 [Cyphomyrmex costatus]